MEVVAVPPAASTMRLPISPDGAPLAVDRLTAIGRRALTDVRDRPADALAAA